MKLLVTTYNYIALLDTRTQKIKKIDQGSGKYFGISWNDRYLYVTVGVRFNLGEKYGQKKERVLVFDKNLKLLGELFKKDIGLNNVHQILLKDKKLWMMNSGKNRVDIFDFQSRKLKRWYPGFMRYYNYNHFNSILINDNKLFLVAHNHSRPSQVYMYSYPQLKLKQKLSLGSQAHNLYADKNEIYVCDSLGSMDVVSQKGSRYGIGAGYVRGLAVSEAFVFAGSSKKAKRAERQSGDCHIFKFNRETRKLIKKINLKGAGNIYDIRILDEYDHAHQIEPFLK